MTYFMPGWESLDLEPILAQYRADGYARLPRVLSDEGLRLLSERSDQLMLGEVTIPGLFFQADSATGNYEDLTYGLGYQGPSLAYRKIEKLERDERFWAVIQHPLFARIARALIPGDIAIYRAIVMNKPEGGGTPLPWHQDGGRFWGLSKDPELQIWTALDDVPAGGGAVEVLPGSHLGGLATPLGGIVPADRVEARGADTAAVELPARAGEALLIHNYVWHRSGRVTSGKRRRAFSVAYMSAETKCLRKKGAPRSFVRVF